ncbi:MAG TPA: hypothetical protein VHR86_04130 [Armatimonadota bacterium]|nr:hypothetical protein [Armatimonadota bacterium]
MATAKRLPLEQKASVKLPTIGVFATGDPRLDKASRERCVNIVEMAANVIYGKVKLPDGTPVPVVYSPVLVDGEPQADIVARQFQAEGVDILVCVPDTWAFPQLGMISLLSQFPSDTPINITTGNSGPKPGVVFAQAVNGAIAQYGELSHLNVGTWPDTGANPEMTESTAKSLIDWCYAAVTRQALRGRRILIFGHDSMGMETALAHIIPTRRTFGLEIARLDMKLLADMLKKKSYDEKELKDLRGWLNSHLGDRIQLKDATDSEELDQCLGMYLITRNLMRELNAVGGGFMSQLEWGTDRRGLPLPVADPMETLFNSSFDHNGPKAPTPFATEADVQGLLTMLFLTYLGGGTPPLFMDFRKVWEPWELSQLADKLGLGNADPDALWRKKGLVDGNNSGSASLNWAAKPGASVEEILKNVSMPLADPDYFPGGGNSLAFVTPGGIDGIAARMSYNFTSNLFSMVWDEATTTSTPEKMTDALIHATDPTWPHTFVVPEHATMVEYKQYAPANHFHMNWGLNAARLEYWMDMSNVLSVAPWQARPQFTEGVDRPLPLLYLQQGGENNAKLMRAKR